MSAHNPSAEGAPARSPLLSMRGINKSYGPIRVLGGVDLDLYGGEVLALVGENGAGKSTLMRILAGAAAADSGTVEVGGKPVAAPSPTRMLSLGISVIYQELMLAPHLSVAENIFLGRPLRNGFGLVDWPEMRARTRAAMERLGFDIDPDARVENLSVAHRQIVEIARALTRDARVIVLDEPSAVLGEGELVRLFEVIDRLRKDGVALVYISHRLNEVMELCDRVTVLRDGDLIWTRAVAEVTLDEIVNAMVGRELSEVFPERRRNPGPVALSVRGLNRGTALRDLSFDVRKGEILGVCGLAGAGRTELLRAVIGADPSDSISLELHGKPVTLASPQAAWKAGVGLIPEDRKTEGLFLAHPIAFNISIAGLQRLAAGPGLVSLPRENRLAEALSQLLRIRTPDVKQVVGNLSGGNQQKCMIARSAFAECDVVLIDEPTRGVDIGAKREIYQILGQMADERGVAVIMVSSELPEILGLCDRILVMREGVVAAELDRAEASQEVIMHHATLGH